MLNGVPIKRKLLRALMLTSGLVLFLTFTSFLIYEVITFRHNAVRQLAIQAKIIASNSTGSLAFDSPDDADEVLAALKAEPHIEMAAIIDKNGKLFAHYPKVVAMNNLPGFATTATYRFEGGYLISIEPIVQNDHVLGIVYLKSNTSAMYDRLQLYASIVAIVITITFSVAYIFSNFLQRSISWPILALAETARAVSEKKDYSVRAIKTEENETGTLTDAFNQMLAEIESQNARIQLFNQNLELTIRKRTEDLEAANKEMEAFSYSVSHDLRAPLRSINGYSKILLEDYGDQLGEPGRQTLNTVIRNAVRMGQLIDDLLHFSRLGKQSVKKIKLDMTALAQNVFEDIKGQYAKEIDIQIHALAPVDGDSSMIRQVMQNLLSNAIKYSTKKDVVKIEVGSFQQDSSQVYYVKDNGAGFDMKYYDKLFGVFQRLHSASEFEGTGVGLALVHRIITKHDGKIWAEGKENEGATFYFSLPIIEN
jgi:signal transduction histidine kinase